MFALEITISVPVAKYFESSPKISTKSLKAKSELVGLRLEKNNKSALETMKRPTFSFNEQILFHLFV